MLNQSDFKGKVNEIKNDIICENTGIYDLSQLEDPNFIGTWDGVGVTGSDFDPTGLSGSTTLTFTSNEVGSMTTMGAVATALSGLELSN